MGRCESPCTTAMADRSKRSLVAVSNPRAVAIEPNAEGVHANLGGAYTARGELAKAEQQFDIALKINPANIEALHNKSVLMARKGNFVEALRLNRKVLELSPGLEPALRFKEKIEKLVNKEPS